MRDQRQSSEKFGYAFMFQSTHSSVAQACTSVAFRTFAMREGLRRALFATPLRESISEWPPWTPEVLFYVEIFGQGLPSPAPDRMDSASCARVSSVLLHKDALAAAASAEGLCAGDTRACIPKSAQPASSQRLISFSFFSFHVTTASWMLL